MSNTAPSSAGGASGNNFTPQPQPSTTTPGAVSNPATTSASTATGSSNQNLNQIVSRNFSFQFFSFFQQTFTLQGHYFLQVSHPIFVTSFLKQAVPSLQTFFSHLLYFPLIGNYQITT
ncbi:hypothetical protein F4813DRAFT_239529 [Daldinia decipiens]|uniref:uncharacterized protein n=1 Tax=Daldinia decipiens TaxID=326647 RepID=UPI0020C39891|nr:uncharacterized protein F4813DRAFT_239529 [Daldinia decipiens]KAI1654016.1 hypothetical protein F4813DRAFT_239529 [Daldinia decipiens]